MQLTDLFTQLFLAHVRNQGMQDYAHGHVHPFHTCDLHFFATVSGTAEHQEYIVGMDYLPDDKDLGVACTCSHYRDKGVCRHIWAALLSAQSVGALEKAKQSGTRMSILEPELMLKIIEDVEFESRFASASAAGQGSFAPQKNEWERKLARLRVRMPAVPPALPVAEAPGRQIFYILNISNSLDQEKLVFDVGHRQRKKNGEWGLMKFSGIRATEVENFPDKRDRQILNILLRPEGTDSWRYFYNYSTPTRYDVSPSVASILLPLMSERKGLYIGRGNDPNDFLPVRYEAGGDWRAFLRIDEERKEAEEGTTKKSEEKGQNLVLRMLVGNGREEIPLSDVRSLLPGDILFVGDRLVQLAEGTGALLDPFIGEPSVSFPADHLDHLLGELSLFPMLPSLHSSSVVSFEHLSPAPRPVLRLVRPRDRDSLMHGDLLFDYNGTRVQRDDGRSALLEPTERQIITRDGSAEEAYAAQLLEAGFHPYENAFAPAGLWHIRSGKFPAAARELVEREWIVEAEGQLLRSGGSLALQVSSGIDWFDLDGTAFFDQAAVPFPVLLRAIAQGESTVLLDDGTYGLLPEEWMRRYARLAKTAGGEGDTLRFRSNQIALLDMLLAELPEARFDETFRNARNRLRSFEGVAPVDPPDSFAGELRPYQKTALGWFRFLREFGFGGCLADDMGLGKTVQALALLEERRLERHARKKGKEKKGEEGPNGPSLVVVPKSLIFNWLLEAERFAPNLRVLDYTGTGRREFGDRLEEFDVVLTTYGTLRRDVPALREVEFDYLILDESQAIKNEKSATAKSARLLRGRHRLAMSGTPVENRIEELWSLFEFLNPGMLGSATLFTALAGSDDSAETRAALAQSLRPFILRRTKESVATDLPEKVEQTLYCDLDKKQRKLYNELRDHYRTSLLKEVEAKGMARSKIKVLEALLRLRQAACHPGLVDKTKGKLDCAKFDLLLPQLEEIIQEGHKALVFSQFTSLLGLLRSRLDAGGMNYVYLDGRTRDRQQKVELFQNDPDASLFLISLKAGGVGLNLTAAEYVFLLDPWWNPAVEAQAIDRTHRIGQKNNVFAYRLIARDTVEEKVLELQEKKRELAQAIITGENALIRDLAREDLEMLLS